MKKPFILVAITSIFIGACGGGGAQQASPVEEVSALVYRYTGSVQCYGGGQDLPAIRSSLESAGVRVRSASCGNDGLGHVAACGASDGRIAIFEVPQSQVGTATAAGFPALTGLPYVRFPCPPDEPTLEQGQVVPSDVLINRQKIDFATAPSRYEAVQGWAQTVTLSKSQVGEPALLEIDYLRLLEETDPASGTVKPIAEASFDSPSPHLICVLPEGRCDGALFERDPWFGSADAKVEMVNSIVANGTLQIDVSKTPTKVAHWWTGRVTETALGRRYYIEARFRITGKAALQLGVDYWVDIGSIYNWPQNVGCTNGSNNCQAWASIWFGDTGGVFVTRRVPIF